MMMQKSTPEDYNANFPDRPAIFVSALGPGYIAGGSQCTLAMLQGVSELHRGKVTFIGPAPVDDIEGSVKLTEYRIVDQRTVLQRIKEAVTLYSVDRTTRSAIAQLRGFKNSNPVVYVNGEYCGRVVVAANDYGFSTVFIPHNFPPEYLAAERNWLSPSQALRRVIGTRNSLQGFQHATGCICLTEKDARNFQERSGKRDDVLSQGYFSYRNVKSETAAQTSSDSVGTNVLIGTNMALRQNADGIIWFLKNVWSHFHTLPGWNLTLAGRYPRKSIYDAVQQFRNISVVSRPTHERMEEIFGMADISVACTFKGSGIKLRVAESLRRGIPVVCTEHCAVGYEMISSDVMQIFKNSNDAIGSLHSLSKLAKHRRANIASKEFCTHLSFESGLQRIGQFVLDIL